MKLQRSDIQTLTTHQNLATLKGQRSPQIRALFLIREGNDMIPNDPNKLISELSDFNAWKARSPEKNKFTLLDYVACVATPDLMVGFSELFFPKLITHDGEYFIASRFSLEAYSLWRAKPTPIRDTQIVMNHIHIGTLVQNQKVSNEMAIELAHIVARFWAKLFSEYGLTAEATGSDLWDAQVTLYRK